MPYNQSSDGASASISGTYNDVGHDQINKNHTEIAFSPTINDNKKTVNNYAHNFSGINENVGNMTINYGGNTTNSFVDNSFKSVDDHSVHENVVFGASSLTRAVSQDSHAFNDASSVPHTAPSHLLRTFQTWAAPSDTATGASHRGTISHGLEGARTTVNGWLKKHHIGFQIGDHDTTHSSNDHRDVTPMPHPAHSKSATTTTPAHPLELSGTQTTSNMVTGANASQFTNTRPENGQAKSNNKLGLAGLNMVDDLMKERLRENTGNTIINYGGNTTNVSVDNSTETMDDYSINQMSVDASTSVLNEYDDDAGDEEDNGYNGGGDDDNDDDDD